MSAPRFHWADYLVTVVMLLISLGVGLFFALFKGGQKKKTDYLLGGRRMGLAPVCLSLFAACNSAVSVMGVPADVYNTGSMTLYLSLGFALAYVAGYFTVVPVMYPLHLTSVYQYLQLRFRSRAVRLLGTAIGMFQTILYMGVALLSPGLALQAAAGLPLWVSLIILGGIGTLSSAAGGIQGVVWNNALQTVVMFIGITTVFVKGLDRVGGFWAMLDIARDGHRLDFADVDPDPRKRHTVWGGLIGGSMAWLVNCFSQASVQRIASLQTRRSASIAFLLNAPLNITYGAILLLSGLVLYAYVISIGCDPYKAGLIQNQNQMMPYLVLHVLGEMPGFAGLYMSMLFSGALSTVPAGINALAANTVEDLLARPLKGCRDSTVTMVAKLMSVLYGLAIIALTYAMKALPGPVSQGALYGGLTGLGVSLWLAVGSVLYGTPIAGLPPGPIHNCSLQADGDAVSWTPPNITTVSGVLGNGSAVEGSWLTPFTGDGPEGGVAMLGAVTDSVATNWTTTLTDRPFSVYDLSYLWLGMAGVLSTVIAGLLVTCITGSSDPEAVDSRLIFPFCRKICRLPEPVLRPEDTSNVIAMKNCREAWDSLKERAAMLEVSTEEVAEENDHDLSRDPRHQRHVVTSGSHLTSHPRPKLLLEED